MDVFIRKEDRGSVGSEKITSARLGILCKLHTTSAFASVVKLQKQTNKHKYIVFDNHSFKLDYSTGAVLISQTNGLPNFWEHPVKQHR